MRIGLIKSQAPKEVEEEKHSEDSIIEQQGCEKQPEFDLKAVSEEDSEKLLSF